MQMSIRTKCHICDTDFERTRETKYGDSTQFFLENTFMCDECTEALRRVISREKNKEAYIKNKMI